MDRNSSFAVAAVTAAVLAGGVLMLGGIGPAESGTAGPSSVGGPSGTTGGGNDTAGSSGTGERWSFTIDSIESCGTTCRDVTATLENTDNTTRTGVTVTTEVYADGELLWEGSEDVGTLEPGASNTATRRVDVGYRGALAIKSNDGYVTIRTVVTHDDGRTVFEDRKQVA